jgi:hypothetical protein
MLMTRRLLQIIPALAALAVIAPGAQAQFNPYAGFSSAPPFVSMGYGAPPTMVSPYGVQPALPPGGMYGFYGNGYGYPMGGNPYYGPNGYYPQNGYNPAYNQNGYYAPNGYNTPNSGYSPAYDQNGYYPQSGYNPAYNPNGYYAPNDYNAAYAPNNGYAPPPNVLPRTSDTISVNRGQAGRITLNWQGDPRTVSQVTYELLDKNHKPVSQKTITGPPTQVTLTKTPNTVYTRVIVRYLNNTTNTVTSPIF